MVLAERNATDVVRNGRRSRGPSPNTHTTTTATTTATATAGASSAAGAGGAGGGGGAGAGGGGGGGGLANSTTLAGNGSGVGGGGPNHSSNPGVNEKVATAAPGAGTPESSDDDNSTKRNGKAKAKQSEYEEKIRVGRDYQAVCPPLVPEVDRRPELMNERALLVWSPTKEIPDLKLEEYISVAKEKYGYNGEQALGMLFWHKHDLERAVMDLANFTPFPDEWTIEDKVLFEQAFQFHGKSFHRIRQMLPDKSIASLVKYYYSWKKTRHRSSAMDRQEKPIKAAVKDGSENGSEVGSNEESDNDDKIQKNRQTMEQLDKECNTINVEETVVKSATAVAETVTAQPRCSGRWTQDEIQVALLALREYGKNYPMVAKLVTTKTEAHVRTFYLNNRRRYNLDQIVKEYEAGKSEDSGAEDHTESITDGAAATSSAAVTSTPNVVDSSPMAVKAVVDDDNNDVDSSQEALAKKEDKKKSDLVMGITNSAGSEGSSGANSSSTTIVGSTATDATSDAPIKKSSSAMITITDESDTATNSSSEVITPVTAADGTGSTSLIKSVLSSDEPSSVKSIAAGGAVVPSSAVSISNKRDSSALSIAEQPPAKKIGLVGALEFAGK